MTAIERLTEWLEETGTAAFPGEFRGHARPDCYEGLCAWSAISTTGRTSGPAGQSGPGDWVGRVSCRCSRKTASTARRWWRFRA
ncbi:MAG: hypothetical protein HPM95_04900 [Alphaproteobacteria bacterium]|nr:hypothetical protein [Alphaproteobacteria bacterium]